jgi:hypothetical protein
MKIEDFDYLPRMIEPLELKDLQAFFRKRAKEIGAKITQALDRFS